MHRLRLTVYAACLALAAAWTSLDGDGLQAAQGAKVRVGYINNVQSAALVHLKSLSQEENLDVELVPFTRYPDVQKALAVDSVDVGVIAPNGLPAAVAQGDRNVIAIMDLVYGGQLDGCPKRRSHKRLFRSEGKEDRAGRGWHQLDDVHDAARAAQASLYGHQGAELHRGNGRP